MDLQQLHNNITIKSDAIIEGSDQIEYLETVLYKECTDNKDCLAVISQTINLFDNDLIEEPFETALMLIETICFINKITL